MSAITVARTRLFATVLGCVGLLADGYTGPPVPAAGNGTYQGDNQVIRGFGWVCAPPSYQDAVTVTDGRFAYTFIVGGTDRLGDSDRTDQWVGA